MSYTYKIEETENSISVFIESDGSVILFQPHHPEAANFAPWTSVAEAEAWAKSEVDSLVILANTPRVVPAELETITEEPTE